MQELVVALYIAIEEEEFLGDGVLIKYDEIPDVEKITVLMESVHTSRNLHEEEELPVYSTVILEEIVDAAYMRDDSYLMELGDLEKYVLVGGIFGHDFHKRRNLVDLLFVEGYDLAFFLAYG